MLLVHGRIHVVDVLLAQLLLGQTEPFAEALEVDNLPGPEEPDSVGDVRIVTEAENVIVGNASLLFCCNGVRTT